MYIFLAILLGTFSSLCSNFGSNLQKYGFKNNYNLNYWRNKYWLYGLGLNIVGTICDFIALGFAAQSIIVCLSGFGLVSNLFFNKYWLKEDIKFVDIYGVILISLGSIITVSFGNLNSKHFSESNIVNYYIKPGFIFYYTLTLFLVSLISYKINFIHNIINKSYQSLYLCICSGIFGGFSILHGKILLELILYHKKILLSGFFIFIFLQFIFYLITQQHYLAHALKDYDAKYVIPVFNCFFILNSVISGAIYFEELNDFTFIQSILFILGLITILSGVKILSTNNLIDELNYHKYSLLDESELYENNSL
jgi:uncharacterized membrane protein